MDYCCICGRPATVRILDRIQTRLCDATCSQRTEDNWEGCQGHWSNDGPPRWFCDLHSTTPNPKTGLPEPRKPTKRYLIGYRCGFCGAEKLAIKPPPPCECEGARKSREVVQVIRTGT